MNDNEQIRAIHSIDHFMLAVPDLEEARRFYHAFGLDTHILAGRLLLRCKDSRHVWGCLVSGPHKRLASMTFNCYEADYAFLVARLAELAPPAEPHPDARFPDGYWFRDPDGALLQLRVGPKTTIDAKPARHAPADSERGVAGRQDVTKVRPTRLSHVLLYATDVVRQREFYESALGLRLSDESAGIVAFLHAPHGSDHHLLAFAKAEKAGFHHASWDVASVEEVGLGWMQMQQAGYCKVWGPGRHVLGSNYFCYVQDPWGSWCEYSADMDYVGAGHQWPAADHAPEDSLYLWGPPPPAEFIVNAEVTA
ncbi:MAG: VOC family protein [Pseudomonadota bacterium]